MERVMSELANYFVGRKQTEVHMVLYGKEPEIFYPLLPEVILHRPAAAFNNKYRTWHSIKRLYYLRNEIKKIRPDTILSFGEYWNSFVLLALSGLKTPVYVSDRCQPDKSLGRKHDWLRRFFYCKANGIIVQTRIAKEIYKRFLPEDKLFVIGNPIRNIKPDKSEIKKENIVLSVGRLIKTKHHDELIKIFARIDNQEWKLIIVGDDAIKQKNKQKLQELITELQADDHIELAGKQKDVGEFYLRSKIFAFTSSSEGFPNVIGEAMSAGLPVVAFDCAAGPAELIEDRETGYLVPLFDYEAFEDRLKLLMYDDNLQKEFGKNGQQKIKEFSVDHIGEKFFRTILNV